MRLLTLPLSIQTGGWVSEFTMIQSEQAASDHESRPIIIPHRELPFNAGYVEEVENIYCGKLYLCLLLSRWFVVIDRT